MWVQQHYDRLAADLAILDVLVSLIAGINQNIKWLAAVRTADELFLKFVQVTQTSGEMTTSGRVAVTRLA